MTVMMFPVGLSVNTSVSVQTFKNYLFFHDN
jgi:hypothetical protein